MRVGFRSLRAVTACATGLAVVFLLSAGQAPGGATSQCASSHVYLGNYPGEKETAWSKEAQGLAHDSASWYVTQADALWKLPLTFDLSEKISGPDFTRGILRVPIQPTLGRVAVNRVTVEYNHFGDPEYYDGFVFVPTEGTKTIANPNFPNRSVTVRLRPVVAVFRASDLGFVGRAELPRQRNAGWLAIGRTMPLRRAPLLLYTSNSRLSANASDPAAGPIFRYRVNFDALRARRVELSFVDRFPLEDEHGRPLELDFMQGGAFSGRGCLYLVNGYSSDFDEADGGISVVDAGTRRRMAKSTSGQGPFDYEFHPGWSRYEEPEGITFWDLDGRGAPGVRGQLHVLMLDNDPDWSGGDEIYVQALRGPVGARGVHNS